jgi:small-conductance mechanosensitive channel
MATATIMKNLAACCLFPVLAAAGSVAQDPAPSVSVLSGEQVVQILDDTVEWYRTLGVQEQNATQPSDLLIVYANRQTADQVVGLAFDIARANAELLSSEATDSGSQNDPGSPQTLSKQQQALETEAQSVQAEVAELKQAGAKGGRSSRDSASKLTELQSELAMVNARKNLLDTMADFVSQNNPKGAGANALKAHIDAIAATLPTSAPSASAAGGAAAPAAAKTAPALAQPTDERYGLLELGSRALKLRSKIQAIEAIDERTTTLAGTFHDISAAPLNQLKAYAAQSEQLSSQADHADSATLQGLRNRFDTTAWLFKQTSDIFLPLSKEAILLQQYRRNLASWRDSSTRQFHEALQILGVRVGVVVAVLCAIFILSEIWRRAAMRYIHEPRRRSQLLLVRRIVFWIAVIGVVGFNLVTEVSTFATFAGLLTAGVAVAMQSVLLSVVGYFFLIGKYGIRVGDRVQIGTVVGEVIDLGLVRMHLMELSTQGPLGPTGRVVGFANLIVFQASGGLFKQIPGVSLEWREINVDLPVSEDYAKLRQSLIDAITQAMGEFSADITQEISRIARSTASESVVAASPHVRIHVSNARMQAVIRYPILSDRAEDIDDRVAAAVFKVIAATPKALPEADTGRSPGGPDHT